MSNFRTCGECALMQYSGGICPIFKRNMSPEEPGCPQFTRNVYTCELCKGITASILVDATDPDIHIVCPNCAQHFGHCPTCKHSTTCAFETDPSPIPKTIQQELRQGNMIQITTVRNPSRIEITCKKGCNCFSEEFGCLRQNNSCSNYVIHYDTPTESSHNQ